jgi:hypothetical protein
MPPSGVEFDMDISGAIFQLFPRFDNVRRAMVPSRPQGPAERPRPLVALVVASAGRGAW